MTEIGGAGLKRRLISATGALMATFALWSALQILAVPVFVGGWGMTLYAQWLTANAAAGMLSLLDIGFTAHFTSQIMAAAARGDRAGEERALATGLALFAAMMAVGGGLTAAAWLSGSLAFFGLETPETRLATVLSACSVLLLAPRSMVGSLFTARGRFTRSICLGSAIQLTSLAGQLAIVIGGGGVAAAAAAQLAAALVVGWALPLAILRRTHPVIAFALRWPAWPDLRFHLGRSALHGLSSGATIILQNLPVLALQGLGAPGVGVVAFTTMRTFAGLIRQTIFQVVLSAAVEMTRQHHQGDAAGLTRLFLAANRISGGGGGLLIGLVFVLGPSFFVLWTHGAVTFDPALALVFVGSAILVAPGVTAMTLLRQTDHAGVLAWAHLAQIGLAGGLCLVLTPVYGGFGAAVAVAAAELLAIGWLALRGAVRLFDLDLRRILWTTGGATLGGGAVGAGAGLALAAALPTDSLPEMLLFGGVWLMVAAPVALFILLSPEQRGWLQKAATARIAGWRNRPR